MNPTSSVLAALLQQVARTLLSLDEVTRVRLEKLDGRSLVIRTTKPPDVFSILIHGSQLSVLNQEVGNPNVILEGSIVALSRLLLGASDTSDVTIEGDELLLQELRQIISGIQPDLESPLIPLIGEKPAQALTDALGLAARSVQSLTAGLLDSTSKGMNAATREHFLDQTSFEQFQLNVQQLATAVDRLNQRLANLESESNSADR